MRGWLLGALLWLACGVGEPTPTPLTPPPSSSPSTSTSTWTSTSPSSSPTPDAPNPRTLLVIPLASHELLDSETRALESLEAALASHGVDVTLGGPSDAELAMGLAWIHGTAPESLPPGWATFETIVLVALVPPTTHGSRRVAGGVDGLLLAHPPSRDAIWSVAIDDASAWTFDADRLGAQLGALLEPTP